MTVGCISLGCAKNLIDAELMLAKIKEAGIEIVSEYCDADVVVINTCGFLEDAKKEAIENIFEVAALKNEGRVKKIIVTGCLAQRYKDEIADEIPEVDAFLGTGSYLNIVEAIKEVMNNKKYCCFDKRENHCIDGERLVTTPFYTAYIKISEGCDNCCSYCAIPIIRGKFRSRKIESIVSEAEKLVKNGVKELNIISQDTTKYGTDIYNKPMLVELLKELSKINNLEWIRVLYTYPERMSDELIDEIANNPKIVKYIDMPIQHCNERILKLMNRQGSVEALTSLINKMRSKIKCLVLRTTLITGFPTETQEEFAQMMDFINNIKFERLGVFCYSVEEGTLAAKMDGQIENDEKLRRQELLMLEQEKISTQILENQIGKKEKVIIEGYDKYVKLYFGRTYADAPEVDGKAFFKSSKKHNIGDIVSITVTDTLEYDILGEFIDE
ncbi:MAG: 30S ribosomal protein S12 methylthiotransferase RimO [Ruminococcaceae bacterium]|nr:30S ribosomal protein S12 methylthiotransferase RimO [Oscillospiraceae bacterium]